MHVLAQVSLPWLSVQVIILAVRCVDSDVEASFNGGGQVSSFSGRGSPHPGLDYQFWVPGATCPHFLESGVTHIGRPQTRPNKSGTFRGQHLSTSLPPAASVGLPLPTLVCLLRLQALTPRRYRLPGHQVPPHLSPDARAPQPHCQQPDSPVWGHGSHPSSKLQASCPAGGKERVRITARANRLEVGAHQAHARRHRQDRRPDQASPTAPGFPPFSYPWSTPSPRPHLASAPTTSKEPWGLPGWRRRSRVSWSGHSEKASLASSPSPIPSTGS